MQKEFDIEKIHNDRTIFNSLMYTSLSDALKELEERKNNKALDEFLEKKLGVSVPEAMKDKKSIVLFRHVTTSNYEIGRFCEIAKGLDSVVQPLFFEYNDDKFTNRNEWKFSLGKICFFKGVNKNGQSINVCENIVDINASNNKPISSVMTKWGQPLVDFHHELFVKKYPELKNNFQDISDWLHKFGPTAKEYYKPFFALFLKHGILFENFLMEDHKENAFVREIILPAFIELYKETGLKPLIVALEPIESEGDGIWLSHSYYEKEFIDKKLQQAEEPKFISPLRSVFGI